MLLHIATIFILISLVSCTSRQDAPATSAIKFEKSKWDLKVDGKYAYRNQMIYDLLHHHQWAGMTKDSLFRKLGQPDEREGTQLFYHYDSKPFLGGLGTSIETLVIELKSDSTVKEARLNDSGWD